jgi:hypothetical protein
MARGAVFDTASPMQFVTVVRLQQVNEIRGGVK